MGLDITLTSVANELIKAKPSENSTVALVNEKGQILASSNPQHGPKQGMLVTVNSPQAHALGKLWKLIKPHANQSRNEQAHDVTQTFQFQGQSWLSYHTQYPLSKNRQMRIVIYSPVSDLTQDFLQLSTTPLLLPF